MNYLHAYHAGGIADVFKHSVLVQLLRYLHKKPAPFYYIDTHAGQAIYNLCADTAQKTLEYQSGIGVLWHNSATENSAINDYKQMVQNSNPTEQLQRYPGSGLLAQQLLRPQDVAVLCELQLPIYQQLKQHFQNDPQVQLHQRNGYEALPTLLPPKTNRGLVLIDPPYEIKDEYTQLTLLMQKVYRRWTHGMYALWFPIKQYATILNFYQQLKQLPYSNILTAELWTTHYTDDATLKGSGLILINPPWQFDLLLNTLLPALVNALHLTAGKAQVMWLVNENSSRQP